MKRSIASKGRQKAIIGGKANVSTVKVHLGRFLKRVRAGEEIIVMDRNQPVAKLIPFSGDAEKPLETAPSLAWADVRHRLAAGESKQKPTRLKRSSLFYLNEEREGD